MRSQKKTLLVIIASVITFVVLLGTGYILIQEKNKPQEQEVIARSKVSESIWSVETSTKQAYRNIQNSYGFSPSSFSLTFSYKWNVEPALWLGNYNVTLVIQTDTECNKDIRNACETSKQIYEIWLKDWEKLCPEGKALFSVSLNSSTIIPENVCATNLTK